MQSRKKQKPSLFATKLRQGLEEILEFEESKKPLKTKMIVLPDPPLEYTAKDIKKIREKGQYSQGVFAIILNVSIKTVQSWESGLRFPSHSTLRLLEIIDKGIYRPQVISKNAS